MLRSHEAEIRERSGKHMNLLEELNIILIPILPVETGLFSNAPPDLYLVITPLTELFEVHGDNEQDMRYKKQGYPYLQKEILLK